MSFTSAQIIGVAFALGGSLMWTFAPSVFPEKYHTYGFYIGVCLVGLGVLIFILNTPAAQRLASEGWPKTLTIVLGAAFVVSGVWWFFTSRATTHTPTPASLTSNISFQKFALFWVGLDKGSHQLGAVIKFFNFDDKPHPINGIVLDVENWTLFPRGSYHLKTLLQYEDRAELLEDGYIKASEEAFFKKLLPIKFDLTISGGDTPELVLRGKWSLKVDDRIIIMEAPLYAVYPQKISEKEWTDLLKSQSNINIDDLHFKEIPERPPADATDINYLVYNRDRSADIENPYFAQTNAVRGENGVMVFIRGSASLPKDKGWVVLGHTYHEVWSDSEKLALYNSLFPPDENGLPKAFGFFLGIESEMGGPVGRPLSAPVTRAADILEFNPPNKIIREPRNE